YGAYDFSNGACLLWENGWCNGQETVSFLRALAAWRAGKRGRLVGIWGKAPCHVAKGVKAEAARLGIQLGPLPGDRPGLNPIESLWDWMREEVSRGFCHATVRQLVEACHATVRQLVEACQAFITRINRDPLAVVDRLWPKFELDLEFE